MKTLLVYYIYCHQVVVCTLFYIPKTLALGRKDIASILTNCSVLTYKDYWFQ